MCLSVPARITHITDGPLPMATIDCAGTPRTCSLAYVPHAQPGDYVLFQNGFAIDVVEAQEAEQTLAALAEYQLLDPNSPLINRPAGGRQQHHSKEEPPCA